ncbi:hypothetical protein H0H93_014955 [Arthromyces matolae]|nr:hypothetical protein H0H93_014955 [Arthromyces matolae]
MTVAQLGDQLSIHKKILNDEVLHSVLQKDLKNRAIKLSAVLAAVTRNEKTIALLCAVLPASVHQATNAAGLENDQDDYSHDLEDIYDTTHISDSEEEPELRLPPTKHIKLDKSLHQPSAPISPPYSLDTNRSISRNVNQQLTQLEKRVASLEMQVSKGFERVFGELEEMKELLTKNLTGSGE